MHDASRVNVFQPSLFTNQISYNVSDETIGLYQYLVEEVLDELLLKGSGGEEAMQIGSE